MPELNCETVTLHKLDYSDFEQFVQEVYGRSVEIVPAEEWGNDEDHTFKVKKAVMRKWDAERMLSFQENGDYGLGITRVLFQDMVNNDLIEEGEYLIQVSW